MRPETILKYNARVPRYTSYPTAVQFHAGIGPAQYADWLKRLPAGEPLSLYLHVPFCRSLCWYCGCNMRVVRRDGSLESYTEMLLREIALVAARLPGRMTVRHLHWGGGTPTALGPERLARVMEALGETFDLAADAEVAIEIDPRVLDEEMAAMLGRLGFNRASLGVQDLEPQVQQAVNRLQSWEETAGSAEMLRRHGVERLNIDLIYGLPHQDTARVARTAIACAGLEPERFALFGYAHVPWMKPHQTLIDEASLPGPAERLALFAAAADCLAAAGYEAIGLDHFARADSTFAAAAREGRLYRNFQGYTDDPCRSLIGLGASSIGDLPQGLLQNHAEVRDYASAIRAGRLATARGVARSADDALRGDIIERLMCDLRVDLAQVCARHGADPAAFSEELERLAPFVRDGLVRRAGSRFCITEDGRPIVRAVCALFDRHLLPARFAHAAAV
ncbi:MAG TPA: oxygen-independent coproporphyrinogen III oxidase [Alphaproteobacteria bacterium]|nr:oxygen-independent coproporphyrinogen III oxidase [Alphaproteobacteria bacterium]